MVDTLKEAEERIRAAMLPPQRQGGPAFSPNIQQIRNTAQQRKQLPPPQRSLLTQGR